MSARELAANPFVYTLSAKLQGALAYVRQLPLPVWRKALIAVSLLWLVHSLSGLFWLLFPVPDMQQPTRLAAPPMESTVKTNANVDLAALKSLSEQFGESVAAPVEVVEEVEPEPELDAATTKLNLKLQGVITSNDQKLGSAIIADGKDQSLYFVGEEIANKRGVKLARVLEQRVILDNKGNFESLWLYSEDDFKKSSRKSSSRRVPVNRSPVSSRKSELEDSPQPNTISAKARRDQLPKSVGDVVRFSVHREGGKMVGYRIRPGRDRELFEQVGLKTNDIVTSVNGIEVNDPTQIREVYKSLKTATEAQLTVMREGETYSINISLDDSSE